jgi:hypothetical protein
LPCRAGITFDAATYKNNNAGDIAVAFQHTCAGSQRLLVFSITLATTTSGVSAASYGGYTMTFLRADSETTNVRAETWTLVNPPLGSNTLAVTLTAASVAEMGCLSLNGVDTTAPLGTSGAVAQANSSVSLTLATANNNSWLVGILSQQGSPSFTAGAGINQQWGPLYNPSCGATGFTMPTTTAGLYTMSFSISAFSSVVVQAAEIVAAPTATPALPGQPGGRVVPDPFTPALSQNNLAQFSLSAGHGAGSLRLVDLNRRQVRRFDFAANDPVFWDGKDDQGNLVHSGVYVYLLRAGDFVRKGTVTVLR